MSEVNNPCRLFIPMYWLLAVVGGADCGVVTVASRVFGNILCEDERARVAMIAESPADDDYVGIGYGSITVAGTLTFALVFFVTVAVYDFVNWKYLAETWGIG